MNWSRLDEMPPPVEDLALFCDMYYEFVLLGISVKDGEDLVINVFSILEIPEDFTITHWHPLPKPPGADDKD